MTKTIFTGEQVEKFSHEHGLAIFAFIHAKFTWLTKHFLMRNGPRNTGNRYGNHKQLEKLQKNVMYHEK